METTWIGHARELDLSMKTKICIYCLSPPSDFTREINPVIRPRSIEGPSDLIYPSVIVNHRQRSSYSNMQMIKHLLVSFNPYKSGESHAIDFVHGYLRTNTDQTTVLQFLIEPFTFQ